jgi:hypothetical protein
VSPSPPGEHALRTHLEHATGAFGAAAPDICRDSSGGSDVRRDFRGCVSMRRVLRG